MGISNQCLSDMFDILRVHELHLFILVASCYFLAITFWSYLKHLLTSMYLSFSLVWFWKVPLRRNQDLCRGWFLLCISTQRFCVPRSFLRLNPLQKLLDGDWLGGSFGRASCIISLGKPGGTIPSVSHTWESYHSSKGNAWILVHVIHKAYNRYNRLMIPCVECHVYEIPFLDTHLDHNTYFLYTILILCTLKSKSNNHDLHPKWLWSCISNTDLIWRCYASEASKFSNILYRLFSFRESC